MWLCLRLPMIECSRPRSSSCGSSSRKRALAMLKRCGTLLDQGLRINSCHCNNVSRSCRAFCGASAASEQAGAPGERANEQDKCMRAASDSALAQKLASVERWVVFSDLHVHPKFAPYWQDALATVDKLAKERSAGVLFLVRPPLLGNATKAVCVPTRAVERLVQ